MLEGWWYYLSLSGRELRFKYLNFLRITNLRRDTTGIYTSLSDSKSTFCNYKYGCISQLIIQKQGRHSDRIKAHTSLNCVGLGISVTRL